MTRLRRFCYKR